MSADNNKEIVRRFFDEVVKTGEVDRADELFSTEFVAHFGGVPGPIQGIAAWKQLASMLFNAFPDLNLDVAETFSEGDKVVARWQWGGTQSGELMGIPPTGRQVSALRGIGIYRIDNGRIAEEWVQEDMLGMLQQLGVVPAPDQTVA